MSHKLSLKTLTRDLKGFTTVQYTILLVVIVVVGLAVWKRFGFAVYRTLTD